MIDSIYFLWTDILLYLIIISFSYMIYRYSTSSLGKLSFIKIFKSKVSIAMAVILSIYFLICILDSIHFKTSNSLNYYNNPIISVLDIILSPISKNKETTYSSPMALYHNNLNNFDGNNKLQHIPSHIINAKQRSSYVLDKFTTSVFSVFCLYLLLLYLYFIFHRYSYNNYGEFIQQIFFKPESQHIKFAIFFSGMVLFLMLFVYLLSFGFHVLGTNKVGEDVLYLCIKSIRTSCVLSIFTLSMLVPLAVLFGVVAGYYGGYIDDIIQYLYTTISSIPGILLIAASILSLQVFVGNYASYFQYIIDRSDLRILILCFILAATGWPSLCRIIRAETLKLRELDFIDAAISLGRSKFSILFKHILPNLRHLILISIVIDFSTLILAEAILSYVGVGVSPTTISWGNMINGARNELAREPVVWWPILSAFIFMFLLVFAANIFADKVRDALDPKFNTIKT